tara:strand:- start:170 stop:1654 length:1485 start_codon:yes stop_codon:yes gene_type:complete
VPHAQSKIRVRFAPSPTGTLHIGGARTALFNFLFARHHQGEFILRIEDTDTLRNSETALKQQLDDLKWLGLEWDEGIINAQGESIGPYGPYRQSERRPLYEQYLHQLIEQGLAYYCFMSEADVESEKAACKIARQPYRPSSPDRDQPLAKALERLKQGNTAVIRFKAPETPKTYTIEDLVRGTVTFSTQEAGDFIIARTDGMPMYNFACVIDDALMEISHVFRGEEHLTNTLRQLMLFDALNLKPPVYGHASIILGASGKKLSKRDGAAACDAYREQGYLPQAVINYMALLGWNDGTEQEHYTLPELIQAFSTSGLNAAAPVFDLKKLTWLNHQHLIHLSPEDLWRKLAPWMPQTSQPPVLTTLEAWQDAFCRTVQPHLNTLLDARRIYEALCSPTLTFDEAALDVLSWPTTAGVLHAWIEGLSSTQTLTPSSFQTLLKDIQSTQGIKGKALFMPLRVAMIGMAHGTELKQLIELLPRDRLLDRARTCQQRCVS